MESPRSGSTSVHVELETFASRDVAEQDGGSFSSTHDGHATQALPPVDRGKGAWTFLAAAFVNELLVWGLPYSVGILHQYWSTVLFAPLGPSDSKMLAVAATLQTGFMYCSCIVYGPLLQRYPRHRAKMQGTGMITSVLAVIASAFASRPWHLIVTIGIMYPLGATVYYLPACTLCYEWFQKKRGLAFGILYSGTGIGGATFPFIMETLLNKFGYRAGLISLGIGYGVLASGSLLLMKPRIPVTGQSSLGPPRVNPVFLSRSTFYAFGGAMLLTSLGNFIPSIYLPAYAEAIGLKTRDGTMLVAVMNAASVPGLLLMGYLTDKLPLRIIITLCCLGSALACLLLWGFATSVGMLVAFAIAFGFLGLSFSGVVPSLVIVVAKDDPHLPSFILCLYALLKGVGNISSGPISDSLLGANKLSGSDFGYGVDNYGSLLLYTGLMMVAGTGVGIAYRD